MKKSLYLIHFVIIFCLVIVGTAQQDVLLLGEFKVSRVIDGDTIGVEGLPDTIRFLCIDTEECEKGSGAEERTAEITKTWMEYVKQQTSNDPNPKFNTPMGMEAKHFAEKWFPIGSTVRIEYDELGRKIDYYGRNLGYLFVKKDGKWVNYNVECVRAGMSPYLDKYGPSKRFESEFIEAEREARINQRGIWAPNAMAYPNYDSRLRWWNRRGKAIKHFDRVYGSKENGIDVLNDDDWARLPTLIGKEIILFGSAYLPRNSQAPVTLNMNHNNNTLVGISITDPGVLNSLKPQLEKYRDDMVYFKGILQKGGEQNNRTYAYFLSINSPDQFFVENPGVDEPETIPTPVAQQNKTEIPIEPKKIISSIKIEGEVIPWLEAPKHKDKEIVTSGKIIRTNNIGNLTFLNFSEDFNTTLTIVIFRENYSKFPEPPETMYRDHTIKVKGTVTEYQGKPQIIIQGPEQIEILE